MVINDTSQQIEGYFRLRLKERDDETTAYNLL